MVVRDEIHHLQIVKRGNDHVFGQSAVAGKDALKREVEWILPVIIFGIFADNVRVGQTLGDRHARVGSDGGIIVEFTFRRNILKRRGFIVVGTGFFGDIGRFRDDLCAIEERDGITYNRNHANRGVGQCVPCSALVFIFQVIVRLARFNVTEGAGFQIFCILSFFVDFWQIALFFTTIEEVFIVVTGNVVDDLAGVGVDDVRCGGDNDATDGRCGVNDKAGFGLIRAVFLCIFPGLLGIDAVSGSGRTGDEALER